MMTFAIFAGFIIFAPAAGGLIAGIDRVLSARLQGRIGPPLLQPFYDVLKLLEKENIVVRHSQNIYILFFLIFTIFTGAVFFTGNSLLLVIFALTLADTFFVLAAYKASSPYSLIGAQRELLQMVSCEPSLLLVPIGMYMTTGTFHVESIFHSKTPIALYIPGILVCFLYILVIKFRKSPFDISASPHHAHQELVRGIITEFSGPALAAVEIAHWYENVLLLGILYLFFAFNPILAPFAVLIIYVLGIFLDNICARLKWQFMFASSWAVALVFGAINIIILDLLKS
jgi:formate hydrogenlyase subunit 4